MYLVIFNLMLGCLVQIDTFSEAGIQPIEITSVGDESWTGWEDYAQGVGENPSGWETFAMTFVTFVMAIPKLLLAIGYATILFPLLLDALIPYEGAAMIKILLVSVVWFLYALGIIQLWLKHPLEPMT